MADKTENKSSLSEAEEFLESLNLPDSQSHETDEGGTAGPTDPNDIMSFLDEISNYPTEETAIEKKEPINNNAPQQAAKTVSASSTTNSEPKDQKIETLAPQGQENNDNGWKSWGNSFWSQASAAVKTTTDQINRSVGSDSATKLLEDRVKTLQNLVNKENIEKLGIINLAYYGLY